MNFIKDLALETLPHVVDKTYRPSSGRKMMAEGLCLTCDNRRHCVWQENKKQFCEHFE